MGINSSQTPRRQNLTAQDIIHECNEQSKVKQSYVLVTGATSGIGIETGRTLALAGAKVYLMGRSETKLQKVVTDINEELQQSTAGGSVQGVLCDLNSLASIKTFAQKFIQDNVPLNILILNAGIFNYKFAQTVDGLEQVMGVNHIGHAYLTKLLMPVLIANSPSRIVVVSSELQSGPPLNYQALEQMSSASTNRSKSWGMLRSYQQSKLANVLFARALAARYKDKQITAYSLHPGVIDTNLTSQLPLQGILKKFITNKTPEQGAATSVFCAIKPGLETENGRFFKDSTVTYLGDKWTDDDLDTFWKWTEKIIDERTANLS
ncbi:unnamed protein product [Adineta ricciae]|uniref:Uncharacterized protein n=1 Tax=Adineta ricciae TaxID=249248 RepID=A0A814Z1Z9_ADIRI|nr:unnamed protein product [Adineta ricciae]